MHILIAVLIAIIIYAVQYRLYQKNWNKNLMVEVLFEEEYVSEGGSASMMVVVHNAKSLPLPAVHVKFSVDRSFVFLNRENAVVTDAYYRNDVFSVLGNQKITRILGFYARKRGLYFVKSMDILVKDLFLTKTFAMNVKNASAFYVFPAALPDARTESLCMTLLGEIERKQNLQEDPYTFRGIRGYDRTDVMSKINWKSSAKTGELMVNLYSHSSDQYIRVLLNLETHTSLRMEYLRELTVRLAYAVCTSLLERHVPVTIASNGIDLLTGETEAVEAGATEGHLVTIGKYLARITESAGEKAFESLLDDAAVSDNTNISYVIISPYYKESLLEKIDLLTGSNVPVSMLVPYYDREPMTAVRPYVRGWEVAFDET